MIFEHLENIRITALIAVISALILSVIDIRLSNGLMLGVIIHCLYLEVLTATVNKIIRDNHGCFIAVIFFFFDLMIIASGLVLAFIFADIFNYIATFGGLMIPKITFLIKYFRS